MNTGECLATDAKKKGQVSKFLSCPFDKFKMQEEFNKVQNEAKPKNSRLLQTLIRGLQ